MGPRWEFSRVMLGIVFAQDRKVSRGVDVSERKLSKEGRPGLLIANLDAQHVSDRSRDQVDNVNFPLAGCRVSGESIGCCGDSKVKGGC
jgi:hypothetical protein